MGVNNTHLLNIVLRFFKGDKMLLRVRVKTPSRKVLSGEDLRLFEKLVWDEHFFQSTSIFLLLHFVRFIFSQIKKKITEFKYRNLMIHIN